MAAMTKIRRRSEEIREFILDIVENNAAKVIPQTMKRFNITRQAVSQHIQHLIRQEILIHTNYGLYELRPQEEWSKTVSIAENSEEDVVWRNIVAPQIGKLADNALDIWHYGFTEMFNNVVDHSEGSNVLVLIKKTAHSTQLDLADSGVGIFNKIKNAMNLLDERQAVIELTKGKLTTDPKRHTGEGIFFTSQMFDVFHILSGEVYLSHRADEEEDWILQPRDNYNGTRVSMKLKNSTSRTTKEIFSKFTDDDSGFTKTVVPVRLAQYGNEKLISRSQAKRLLDRVDRFKTVLFDFTEVEIIGQAFADEVFRVFANEHPQIEILPIHANAEVTKMIKKITSGISQEQGQLF
jgi:putative ubiquitin-RnfH superfamily antitoxin RatB of RatAB toxin-antitoxin module